MGGELYVVDGALAVDVQRLMRLCGCAERFLLRTLLAHGLGDGDGSDDDGGDDGFGRRVGAEILDDFGPVGTAHLTLPRGRSAHRGCERGRRAGVSLPPSLEGLGGLTVGAPACGLCCA